MVRVMEQNPRGLGMFQDEGSAILGLLGQYKGGKGTDREFFLKAWAGESYSCDRVGNIDRVPIWVPHPYLSILGNMNHDILVKQYQDKGAADGFKERFLVSWPDRVPKPAFTFEGVPREAKRPWFDTVNQLLDLPMVGEGEEAESYIVRLSPEAREELKTFIDNLRAERNSPDFQSALSGLYGKLETYLARIALILHLIEHVSNPLRDKVDIPPVSLKTMRNAGRLIAYFRSHAIRFYTALKLLGPRACLSDDAHSILGWIERNRKMEFTEHEINKDLVKTFRGRPAELNSALRDLARHGFIKKLELGTSRRTGPGRKQSAAYQVNPRLFDH
jgi:hypothetical protein